MAITIETIQPLNTFFKKQETNAATRFETSFENWRKLGEIIAEVIAITGGKNWSDKAVKKSVEDGKLDNSALTLLANLTDIQARNTLRADCLWLAQNIKDAEFVIGQRKEKGKKNTSLASLHKQVREWKKENERAERIAKGTVEKPAETAADETTVETAALATETVPPTEKDFVEAFAGLMVGAKELGFNTNAILKQAVKIVNANGTEAIIPTVTIQQEEIAA
tara:strand:- start:185 stop:853 length:669 start_codon:yes stop_codon:yes gene_type:complete